MTKTRILAALVMAPSVIGAVLLLPTGWLMLLSALVFLAAMWEWLKLADIEDALARSILLACNLALMVALVWGSRSQHPGALPLFQLTVVLGVVWWLLALLWLRHYDFASRHDGNARVFKLAAGTAAVVPAWCARAVIHAAFQQQDLLAPAAQLASHRSAPRPGPDDNHIGLVRVLRRHIRFPGPIFKISCEAVLSPLLYRNCFENLKF